MFCAVKDQGVSLNGHGGDEVWILRHVTSLVDLSRVVDLLDDIEGDGLFRSAVATNLLLLCIIVGGIDSRLVGEVDGCDLKVVLSGTTSVCSDQKAMSGKVLVGHGLHIGQPLGCEGGPFQSSTVDDVVQEDGILLPDLVLFVDDLVLDGGVADSTGLGGEVCHSVVSWEVWTKSWEVKLLKTRR